MPTENRVILAASMWTAPTIRSAKSSSTLPGSRPCSTTTNSPTTAPTVAVGAVVGEFVVVLQGRDPGKVDELFALRIVGAVHMDAAKITRFSVGIDAADLGHD